MSMTRQLADEEQEPSSPRSLVREALAVFATVNT